MVLFNETSTLAIPFTYLSRYVFGSDSTTLIVLLVLILVVELMVKVPFPIAVSVLIPFVLVVTAMSSLSYTFGATLVVGLVVMAGLSLIKAIF